MPDAPLPVGRVQRRAFLGAMLAATLAPAAGQRGEWPTASPDLAPPLWADGVHDDFNALQAMIDAAHGAGGGVVRLGPGVFLTGTTLRMRSKVTLDLAGGTLRRGFNTSTRGAALLVCRGGEHIALRNGTLDGNGQRFTTSFNLVGAEDVSHLSFDGVTFLSVVDFHAIDLAGCSQVTVSGCHFLGFHDRSGRRAFSEAIQLDPGIRAGGTIDRHVTVSGCRFDAAPGAALADFGAWPCALGNHSGFDGLYHHDIRFADNRVTGADWAGLNLLNMRDVRVEGNTFTGCRHAVRLRLKDDVSPAQACDNVAITGNRFTNGRQAAVKFADPSRGHVARLKTGRHTGVGIVGNVSDGGLALAQVCWASRVSISGNVHSGGVHGIDVRFADRVTIHANECRDLAHTGVWVHEGTETAEAGRGHTADITVSGNTLHRCGQRGVHVDGAVRRVTIAANQVIDPSKAAPTREGIRVEGPADGVSILDNQVAFTGVVHSRYGISVSDTPSHVVVRGNQAAGSTSAYQVLAADARIEIEGEGSPEGVFSAATGSRYTRRDSDGATSLYIKASGTGTTGWAPA